ncbi:hypothetical protein E2C01_024886 [Portunus trituberculatus]|uniref:Uncharacterized protein n=1 Tax=Portunus trituberculatus TaxID=210409 RepID=A0A5B7EBW9_PORTR|nr:hypothetical protein [Portunus trituberculatus]
MHDITAFEVTDVGRRADDWTGINAPSRRLELQVTVLLSPASGAMRDYKRYKRLQDLFLPRLKQRRQDGTGRGGARWGGTALRLLPGMQVACWSTAFVNPVGLRENDDNIY